MKNSIGIIGHGFIGKILKRYYPNALVFDIDDTLDPLEDVLDQDVIFIAFNLKDNGFSSYEEISRYMKQTDPGCVFIIKSTFVPGTTDALQEEFPRHKIIYNPEFLTEATAWEDFTNPQFQILGMPHDTLELANDLFELLPDAPIKRIISPLDAEVLKHAQNSYYALKVSWFNQLYTACGELRSDYETVREILVQNPWIGDSHSTYRHKGYAGWGGKCLSKDVPALASMVDFPLLDHIIEYNEKLRRQQGL